MCELNPPCLTRSDTLLSNYWLKYLKSSLFKFLTKQSTEELRHWMLSIKLKLLLIVRIIYFSDQSGITFILRLNLPSSCIMRWESYLFRFWITTEVL